MALGFGLVIAVVSGSMTFLFLWLFLGSSAWFGLDAWLGAVPCPSCSESYFGGGQVSLCCRACGVSARSAS